MKIHRDGENPYRLETEFFEVSNFLDFDEDAYSKFRTPKLTEEDELFGPAPKAQRIVHEPKINGEPVYLALLEMWSSISKIFCELIIYKSFDELKAAEIDAFNSIFFNEEKINTNNYESLEDLKKICFEIVSQWKYMLEKHRPNLKSKMEDDPFNPVSPVKKGISVTAKSIVQRMKNAKV